MAATYEVIQDTVLTGTTSIGIGASAEVTIRNAESGALVTLFEDRLGASGETNPFNADVNGQFRVYAAPGRLQISITFESVTRIWEDFRLGPKTPELASGDAGQLLEVNSDEDGYDLVHSLFRSYLAGLGLSNGTDAVNDIDIAIGSCRDSADSVNMKNAAAMGKQIDAAWTAGGTPGTPLGGFPSGLTLTNDTWYHVFAIWNPTSKTFDIGFDTSLTATNLLADATGYTEYRRIGSVLRGTGTLKSFVARELASGALEFLWKSDSLDILAAPANTNALLVTLLVANGIKVTAIFSMQFDDGTAVGTIFWKLSSLDQDDEAVVQDNASAVTTITSEFASFLAHIRTDTSSRIRLRAGTVDSGTRWRIMTQGWIDERIE